jgi:DNA-binding NarL/FixJ family response regulator
MIRIVIAEDQALVRAGLVSILESDPGVEVVGAAADGAEAVEMIGTLRPGVALLDVRMPVLGGLSATRRIVQQYPETKVILLTTFGRDSTVVEALRAGATGFLLKDSPPEELLLTVRDAAAGKARIDPAVTGAVIAQLREAPSRARSSGRSLLGLTARELEVLEMIAMGRSNAEIAQELVISLGTVKSHVAAVLSKLRLRDRVQAVIAAHEAGLFPHGDQPSSDLESPY